MAGVVTATVAVSALSGVATAHFPTELDIDIQPDNEDNVIDLDAEDDHVPVAVLPSTFLNDENERETFDPTTQPVRYRFGSWSALSDGDGARPVDDGEVTTMEIGHGEHAESHEVLLLQFPAGESGLNDEDDIAWLYWERDETGEHGYSGFDAVAVTGGEPPSQEFLDLLRQLIRALSGQ